MWLYHKVDRNLEETAHSSTTCEPSGKKKSNHIEAQFFLE